MRFLALIVPPLLLALDASATVRLDLELPGKAHAFNLLWSIGEGEETHGIATDSSGSIYTTVGKDLVSLSENGAEQWRVVCPAGGCLDTASNGSAVFGSLADGGMVRVAPDTGVVECTYLPGDVGETPGARRIVASDSYVAIEHDPIAGNPFDGAVTVVDAATCVEIYRILSPNGSRPHGTVIDDTSNVMFVAWDEAGISPAVPTTLQYALDTGEEGCRAIPPEEFEPGEENFRAMLVGGRYFAGMDWALCVFDADTCNPDGCYFQEGAFGAGIGDLRDVGYDTVRDRIYLLGNSSNRFSFTSLDGSTLKPRIVYENFVENGLATLNKFALGGRWAFIPDGSNNEQGEIQVLDLDNLHQSPFARFERGRVTRLGDRLVDGGLLLTQLQRGNVTAPDTPFMAFDLGDGAFVGRGNRLGGPGANKYCDSCLTELRSLDAQCGFAPEGWLCTLTNHYAYVVADPTLVVAGGVWEARDSSGAIIGSTSKRELDLSVSIAPGASRAILLAGGPYPIAGKRLKMRDPLGRPELRSLRLLAKGDGVHAPAPGSGDPTVVGGRLRIVNSSTGEEAVVNLPASGWSGLGKPVGSRGYRYRGDPTDACRTVVVKPGQKLKAFCTGEQIEFTLDEPAQIALAVEIELGADTKMCMLFDRSSYKKDEGGRFSASNSAPPVDCIMP